MSYVDVSERDERSRPRFAYANFRITFTVRKRAELRLFGQLSAHVKGTIGQLEGVDATEFLDACAQQEKEGGARVHAYAQAAHLSLRSLRRPARIKNGRSKPVSISSSRGTKCNQ